MADVIQMDSEAVGIDELLKKSCNLTGVLILGTNPDGTDFYGVSGLDEIEMIYLMEKCKHFLLSMEES